MLTHRGRKSGRAYRIPISGFRRPTGYRVVLTYDTDTYGVKNALSPVAAASGPGCTIPSPNCEDRLIAIESGHRRSVRRRPAAMRTPARREAG